MRTPLLPLLVSASLTSVAVSQQYLLTTNTTTDTVVAISAFDGSLVDTSYFGVNDLIQVSALDVNGDVWVSEQLGDRVVRYDPCGNVLGVIGPTFPGGGFDNIRGMNFINGLVYVCNDGANNGATADSLVVLDTAGNHVTTLALSNSPSPFCVIPFQGDLLVSSSSANNDVHRYTTSGASVGVLHNSTTVNFAHQLALASDGNVWCGTLTSDIGVKLDATTGNVLLSFPASGCRGIYELQNGNVAWTSDNGIFVYDVVAGTSTQVSNVSAYQLNPFTRTKACHKNYGIGCHLPTIDRSNLFELFGTIAAAKTALDGNAMTFTFTGNGYAATWLPGAAAGVYVTPSVSAPIIANADSTTTTITPTQAVPVPGGVATTWTVSSNGVLTAGSTGNQGTSGSPTLASIDTEPGLAFYTWANHNPAETSSGKIKWEEIGSVIYVTFEGVEFSGGTPTLAPSAFQFQIDAASGNVTIAWPSFSGSNSSSDVIVGCTLAGEGFVPVSQPLSAANGTPILFDIPIPVELSASPAPIINPSTLVTFTMSNVPEFAPGSGVYLGTMFLSLNPVPAGIDLAGILTQLPGCRAYIGTLDIDLGGQLSVTPSISWSLPISNTVFAPGLSVASQGVALFDPAFPLPNGEAGGFLLSNGVLSTTFTQ